MKQIFTAVAASLTTALILWLIGVIGTIPNIVSVPAGAVVAFDSAECPNGDWKEYKAAHGRFVRGIDRSGSNIDPSGERNPGSFQEDEVKAHSHVTAQLAMVPRGQGAQPGDDHNPGNWVGSRKLDVEVSKGEESRPKNVALLYCIKT